MRREAPSSAMAIANWFIKRHLAEQGQNPPCDQLKLYKLVYYAHAWYLAFHGSPLFADDIEAWPHGPVVRELYNEFSKHRKEQITSLGRELITNSCGVTKFRNPKPKDYLNMFLEAVWDRYKGYTGIALSNSTHESGEPWTIVSKHYDLNKVRPTIHNDIIESVFRGKLNGV